MAFEGNNFDYSSSLQNRTERIFFEAEKIIESMKCKKQKNIGDKVRVWDFSWNEDVETGKHYTSNDGVFKHYGTIIEKNCINIYRNKSLDIEINRDIVVYFPDINKKIATCMDFVRLV